VAGLLKYAPDYTFFLAPYVNSYKRFQPGTFAPTKIAWSGRQPHRRLTALCGDGTKACASSAAFRAPTSIPIWPAPHSLPPASRGSRKA
jgi:hypothetical protein